MRYAQVLLALGLLGVGLVGTPRLLGHSAFFEIRQIEVVGLRYLTPDQIMTAARVEEAGNLFRDLDGIEDRVRGIPGVAGVSLRRKLPGTLRIVVSERMPVAFVVGQDGLIPLDRDARPLPYDPTLGAIDLPVIQRPDTLVTTVLAAMRQLAPTLFGRIDHATLHEHDGVLLSVGERALILPFDPSREVVASLVAVWQRLQDGGRDFTELDGRYDGLIVTRGESS